MELLAEVAIHAAPAAPAQPQAVGVLDRIAGGQMPTQAQYVDSLMNMEMALAIVLLACGLVYMLQGWKIFKMLVIVNAAILGGFVGHTMGASYLHIQHGGIFGSAAGGLLLAVLSWPLMKASVSLMGGLAGAFAGYGLWQYVARAAGKPNLGEYSWAGGLLGLIALGLLAFVIFKLVIMIFTSLQGSLMAISGLVAIACRIPAVKDSLYPVLRSNAHLFLLLVAMPAIIGLVFQQSGHHKKTKKKPEGAG